MELTIKFEKDEFEEIKNIITAGNYDDYGFRIENCVYRIGDYTHNSHQLYQDPHWTNDEDGNEVLLYQYMENGPYEGYYDAGELDGTCAIKVGGYLPEETTEQEILHSLEETIKYDGKYLYLIGGNNSQDGNDELETIIEDAIVLGKYKITVDYKIKEAFVRKTTVD